MKLVILNNVANRIETVDYKRRKVYKLIGDTLDRMSEINDLLIVQIEKGESFFCDIKNPKFNPLLAEISKVIDTNIVGNVIYYDEENALNKVLVYVYEIPEITTQLSTYDVIGDVEIRDFIEYDKSKCRLVSYNENNGIKEILYSTGEFNFIYLDANYNVTKRTEKLNFGRKFDGTISIFNDTSQPKLSVAEINNLLTEKLSISLLKYGITDTKTVERYMSILNFIEKNHDFETNKTTLYTSNYINILMINYDSKEYKDKAIESEKIFLDLLSEKFKK